MNYNAIDAFSVAIAITVFSLSALATTFMVATLLYAFYKERKLRIPSAMPVINLCSAGLLLGVISGLFTLLFDVVQVNIHESYTTLAYDCRLRFLECTLLTSCKKSHATLVI